MKYRFIVRHRSIWPVRLMCRALNVSHGGFYGWMERSPSQRSQENGKLMRFIRQSFEESNRTYGSPRVVRDRHDWVMPVSENRVVRLMREAGLKARHKRCRLPGDKGIRQESRIAPNLLERRFGAEVPNQLWGADFTYGTPGQRAPPAWG
ncbi:MAG: IS3 family transposase [Pseudomonadota bacterium]|nr:IS3 family transposase [Pseudomonadota bacterium]